MSTFICIILLLVILGIVRCGHEVLYNTALDSKDIQPHDLVIVQFDSRPLADYWNVSSRWNKAYSIQHGHQYLFLTKTTDCIIGKYILAPAWCKVKAMLMATELIPDARAFLYIDSDAVISVNYSMSTTLAYIKNYLNWNMNDKPIAFNQDGPGWSCKQAIGLGYKKCLNSGTVFWINNDLSKSIINEWWISAGKPYTSTKFRTKWRTKWPWEQAQLYEIYNKYEQNIMILSFPDKSFLPWLSTKNPKSQYPTDAVEPWCFSHWPGANCFITHHCASINQKKKLINNYQLSSEIGTTILVPIHIIN
eukprot:gene12870-17246_t